MTFRLNQDSRNSNRPSSSNNPFKKPSSRPETETKPGAKKGHEGHGPAILNPRKTVPVKPERCECGNTRFPKTHPYYTHQETELPPIQLDVTHFVLFEGVCPQCGKLVKAGFPEDHVYGYGPRLTALIAWAHAPPIKGEASAWYARMVHLVGRHRDQKDEAGTFARHIEKLMGELWRKMIQGTSSDKGDRWVERILSVRETCRLKGRTTFDVLVEAINSNFHGREPDVSWINSSDMHQYPECFRQKPPYGRSQCC